MAAQRPTPTTVAQHLDGTAQAWHATVSPDGPFPPEKGRYHLYIGQSPLPPSPSPTMLTKTGLFCPFAHRANLVRHLKGLQSIIPITVVKPYPKGDKDGWPGWQFPSTPDEYPGATPDPLFHAKYLHELYFKADPNYTGRYSVPILWDTRTNTIVNNESADLLRDLQTSFDPILPVDSPARSLSLYPRALRAEIDTITPWLQRELNTGVYRAGFATTQEAYDAAVPRVFGALNALERLLPLRGGPYILGDALTELDIRAYCTVVRFDVVYVQHFKCNLGMNRHDYPQLRNWLMHLYFCVEGFKETTDFRHIKENYTKCHGDINPRGITPMGPWPDVEGSAGEVQRDLGKVRVGGVGMGAVREVERELLGLCGVGGE